MSEGVESDLPFKAEYAKSNRSSCKQCKSGIGQGSLRMAVMVQSPHFDGKIPNWFHYKCFFLRARPKAVGDISHYDSLRWEDQEKIKQLLDSAGSAPASGKKGKSATKGDDSGTFMKDFRTEYAKSGGSVCGACEVKIPKGHVRIGKKEYESTRAKMYGPYDKWHHVKCFVEKREELEFFASGEELAGFNTLAADDKTMLKAELKAMKVKRKAETGTDEPDSKKQKVDTKTEELMKKQNKKMYYYRDLLAKNLKKQELVDLLDSNAQEVPTGPDRCLDRLADIMTFGALEPCTVCITGQFVFRTGVGYQCTGNISEWTKCTNSTVEPPRKPFVVPEEFRQEYDFLKLYKYKPQTRVVPKNPTTVKSATGDKVDGKNGSTASGKQLLKGLSFVLEGSIDKKIIEEKIKNLGGTVSKEVTAKTAALITNKETLEKKSKTKPFKAAVEHRIQAVSEDVFDDASKEGIISCIKSKTISSWESDDPKNRITFETNGSGSKSKSDKMLTKDVPKSMKLKLKGGGFVDPDSGLEDKAHVFKKKDALYSVVLGAVDVASGKNSYYKLQVLEHDSRPKWWVFRSWGRVGTTIGGNKLESFDERHEALSNFESLYEDKTGNRWSQRNEFKKVVGKFYPLDIDYGQDNEQIKKLEVAKSTSKLHKAIQMLISLIFDIEQMKKTLVEFEIDTTKMPLGKLSRKQIESAYKILTEVLDIIREGNGSRDKFIDATNRFFTLIPHDFGLNSPPILDNPDLIKNKIEMLDNLLEIEVAYSLLKSTSDDTSLDPIDAHYQKLNCNMDVVDKKSDEFKIIEKYVKHTHASTHTTYSLEIEDVFKIDRKGESSRFKPFKKLHNHMLLWHGSRTTNFAGILSQGLRIAPPEAPVTGYMFGKGIYFADMVSKSANYCQTTRSNNTGLMMLCDVALGNMYERYHADYVEKLPKGMHSTKGVGKTEPDPKVTEVLEGAVVPQGFGVEPECFSKEKNLRSDLLYNEYIVYDVAQVKSKYLLKLKFNYQF